MWAPWSVIAIAAVVAVVRVLRRRCGVPADRSLDALRRTVERARATEDVRRNGCCIRCREEWERDNQHLHWSVLLARTMLLCLDCGNKRCPKASDHRNRCTRSNAVGQPGSRYSIDPELSPIERQRAKETGRG